MQSHQFRAMNSEIVLMAEGDPLSVFEGFEAAESFIHTCEQRFTRFSDHSELARLNRSAGNWFQVSPDLFELVSESLYYFQKTRGLFDPSILPDLKRAGYDRTLDEVQRFTADPQPADWSMGSSSTFGMIELNANTSSIRLPADIQIDLGGIAKGWIAERAARLLNQYASACAVSAGGDMFLIGTPEGQDYWEVELEDPRNPTENITILRVGEGAVVTSSVAKRVWLQGTTSRHHLIDPRSHEPVESDWLSVTVIAPQILTAETFAKAALIGGEVFARQAIAQDPSLTILAVDRMGQFLDLHEGTLV
ncbi:MAG: FAD:protein FMN transferase [Chloroflexi bacterium]|nr:FAD:protein FMN transferase [Chloroflexota bacterium]